MSSATTTRAKSTSAPFAKITILAVPFKRRLPSFSRKSKSSVEAIPVSFQTKRGPPLVPHLSLDSTASCSSWESESSSSSESRSPSIPPQEKRRSKIREYVSGVSAIFLVPIPLKDPKGNAPTVPNNPSPSHSVPQNSTPTPGDLTLRRVLPRDNPPTSQRRNSLVLPEVTLSDAPKNLPPPDPSQRLCCREHPPSMEARKVRFIDNVPPRKFAPPSDRDADDEPAWCDFMWMSMGGRICDKHNSSRVHDAHGEWKERVRSAGKYVTLPFPSRTEASENWP
ncbi:hypothetical protein B0H11DRAFT_2270424 [Mycena galericulata]|nr:hypothetical protein B0H11DRAFT_2270424 [Mycena galericulata]